MYKKKKIYNNVDELFLLRRAYTICPFHYYKSRITVATVVDVIFFFFIFDIGTPLLPYGRNIIILNATAASFI